MNLTERWRQGLAVLDVRLFEIGGTPVSISTLVSVALIILATVLLSKLLQKGFERVMKRRDILDAGSVTVASRLLHYAVLSIGFAIALQTMGINLTALFAAGALFAVAIGFAMQNLTANFVSGLILLAERAVKPGDIVEVNGQIVQIKRMGIRAAIGRTLNEEDLIIPSSELVQSTVKNYTLRDALTRLRAQVGVTYGSDMALVRRTLETVAEGVSWRSGKVQPAIYMWEFGNSSVVFEVSVWTEDPWHRQRHRSELHEAIWWSFKEAGITIAFPQVDVHLDNPVVESLQAMRHVG
jgi:small-conductance mechanosensitive channel